MRDKNIQLADGTAFSTGAPHPRVSSQRGAQPEGARGSGLDRGEHPDAHPFIVERPMAGSG